MNWEVFLVIQLLLDNFNVCRLQAFRTLLNNKLDPLTFLEGSVPIGLDGGVMDEYIRPIVLRQKTITLAIVEPFDRTN